MTTPAARLRELHKLIDEIRSSVSTCRHGRVSYPPDIEDIRDWADKLEAVLVRSGEASQEVEQRVIDQVVAHWFTQGGEAQFGAIAECHNADEVVSAILSAVRSGEAVAPLENYESRSPDGDGPDGVGAQGQRKQPDRDAHNGDRDAPAAAENIDAVGMSFARAG